MLFWTSFSAAEPISVNSTADNTTEDEECTLREAIENAQGASHVDCVAGTFGLDEIHFNYDENHAPVVLDNSNPISLTDINEDVLDTNNTGDQIAKLIKGMIKDADSDKVGIAVIAVDNRQGKWQYLSKDETDFIDFPNEVTESQAVLLDDHAKIRFVPKADYNGTVELRFRAWDRTTGSHGNTQIDTTTSGDITAFSSETATARITVNPVDEPPPPPEPPHDPPHDTTATGHFATNTSFATGDL